MLNLAYWFQVSSDSNLPQTMERLAVYLTFWTRVRKLWIMSQKVTAIYSKTILVVIPRNRGNAVNVFALIVRLAGSFSFSLSSFSEQKPSQW